jgi:hypothetical protein
LLVALLASQVAADDPIEKRVYTTQRINGHPPTIDGRVDDPCWDTVQWSGDFTQRSPYDGEDPSQETEFKILYDDQALYIAYRAWDTEPDEITRRLARRDWFPGDWVEINIDSRHDQRTAFSFTTSVSGTRGDEYVSDDGRDWDGDWDPVWVAKTNIDDRGWTAEVKIPMSQLRYSSKEEQVWGIQIQRRLFREEERSCWQPIPHDTPSWVSRFGELHGIRELQAPRRIELMPYAMGNHERFEEEPDNPFATGTDEDYDFGLDGKIGVTSDLSLDFTVNPDFGQVEADPSEVNLTAFETYFSEKRPFFIEGSDILDYPIAEAITGGSFTRDNLFYSRRIGRRPHGYPDTEDGEFVNVPTSTTILGAAKLSGKTGSGLSIGLMEALTARERAEVAGEKSRRKEEIEPLSNYFVGRVQQDLREGATVLGAIFTATNRDIPGNELAFLHSAAYSGGADVHHSWSDRTYYIRANALFSHVRGDEEAILDDQTSSARYFQRPDADYIEVDSTRTSLSGYAGSARFGRRSSGRIRFESGVAWRSPGFEINDIGFMRRADEVNQFTWAGYYITDPFWIFRQFSFNTNQWTNWDFGGRNTHNSFNWNSHMTFLNNWNIGGGMTYTPEFISNTALRGGPRSKWPGELNHNLYMNSDHRKRVRLSSGTWGSSGEDDSYTNLGLWADLVLQPTDALRLGFHPDLSYYESKLQYVSQESFQNEDRYIFATIDQETAAMTVRLDYCLTPALTIQLYAQPYISAGDYSALKRITSPRASKFEDRFHTFAEGSEVTRSEDGDYLIDEDRDGDVDYEIGDPNFNFKDFNSNLVIRWEFSLGSTLYLVWSQGRSVVTADGNFSLDDDFRNLFDVHPHNVFLIKVNRWFAL